MNFISEYSWETEQEIIILFLYVEITKERISNLILAL